MSKGARFTLDQLGPKARAEAERQLGISHETKVLSIHQSPATFPKRLAGPKSLAPAQTQAKHSGICIVRVTSFRRRLLDTDNLVPKWHIDALRYAGILSSDAPDKARIITNQIKVKTADQERTEVEIEHLD